MKVTGGTRTRNPQSHNLVLHQVELRSQAILRIRTSTYLSNAAIGSDSRTRTCNPLLNRELRYRITLCRNIRSFYRQTSYSSQREQIVRFSRREVVTPRLSTSFYESSAGYSGSRLASRKGFEPLCRISPTSGFLDQRNQPLYHLGIAMPAR